MPKFLKKRQEYLISEARRLRQEGKTLREIASLLHISHTACMNYAKDIPRRLKIIDLNNGNN